MNIFKIFIFGNKIVNNDSTPIKLLPKLKKEFPSISFIHVDPTESWTYDEKNIVIIDTILGIKKVTVFTSLSDFQNTNPRLTPHDYDLYTDLTLLKKLGKIETITIIGIPANQISNKTIQQINNSIKFLISKS